MMVGYHPTELWNAYTVEGITLQHAAITNTTVNKILNPISVVARNVNTIPPTAYILLIASMI